jgi:CCR4-NOT transcription complex subunit 7/8
MRCNVDLLKPVQVGLTLADEDGNYPQDISTWEFNFHFSAKCVIPFSKCITD